MLNSVGLSNPGIKVLLGYSQWKMRTEPFLISFMSVEKNPAERIEELKEFIGVLSWHLYSFRTKIGLQLNFSCPNTSHNLWDLEEEIETALDHVSRLKIPIAVKINALASPRAAANISRHRACDAICVSNSISLGRTARTNPLGKDIRQ